MESAGRKIKPGDQLHEAREKEKVTAETYRIERSELVMTRQNPILEMKKARLEKYYITEEKILNSQSYSLESRTLTRADLKTVQTMIQKLEGEIAAIESRGSTKRKVRRIVPVD